MKRAAAYVRVSDERQDEFSPASQLKLIREYCEKNALSLSEDHIFYDDGISAKSAERRGEFCRMIELARSPEHPIDAVVVWKYSRFCRNQEESIVYKSLLRKNRVEVLSVSEPISSDPFGTLVERIIEWMDEYYLVRLAGEVKRGMKEKALRGKPCAAPPIGLRLCDGALVPDPCECEAVRLCFSLLLGGEEPGAIARELNLLGMRTRTGRQFDRRAVIYVLRNPIYAGYIRWSQEGRMASLRRFDSPNFIISEGEHTGLVSKESFKRAQELLDAAERRKNERAGALLSGLAHCSCCGSRLTVQQGRTRSYQCSSYAKGKCRVSHSVSVAKLDRAVIDALPDRIRRAKIPLPEDAPSQSCGGTERERGNITLEAFICNGDFPVRIRAQALSLFVGKVTFDRKSSSVRICLREGSGEASATGKVS